MNTQANNNDWGEALIRGAARQTSAQVVAELSMDFDKKKTYHVSGSRNRMTVMLTKTIPENFIAKTFARQKQRYIGLK